MKVTNSYSAQVFPSIFNCEDLYCNCGHLSSRPGQDAKKRPLRVKKHPFYKGRLRNVRGSLGVRLLICIRVLCMRRTWCFLLSRVLFCVNTRKGPGGVVLAPLAVVSCGIYVWLVAFIFSQKHV